jgi:tRNA (Thr-GGU) A37 N-methylase
MRLDINLLMVFASLFNWGSVKYEPIDRSSAFGDGMKKIELNPIGNVIKGRTELKDDDWDSVSSTIELDASRFSADALAGLDAFSHVEIVFYMDKVKPEKIVIGARHPRNNQDWPKLGIFAQRAKNRPNPIGTTICRLMGVREFANRCCGSGCGGRQSGAGYQTLDTGISAARGTDATGVDKRVDA